MARGWAVLAMLAAATAGWVLEGSAADVGTSKGTRQVVFSFDAWYLGSYNGGVGIRYFVKDGVAVRPGLEFAIQDHSEDWATDDNGRVSTDSLDADGGTLGASVFLEKYVGGFRALAPFVAVGLGYSFTCSDDRQRHHLYRDYPSESYWSDCYDQSEHRLRLIGALGFQWQFTDYLSLGGQYNLSAAHSWAHRKHTQTSFDGSTTEVYTRKTDSEDTSVGVDAGRLLVSVRF